MSNREAAMMKIEQDKNKKNKSGNQRMTYMKQDNWRQEIISLNEGCKTFHFSTPVFTEVIDNLDRAHFFNTSPTHCLIFLAIL